MTLPFDIPEENKRTYQCFVCGRMYQAYDEYKDHIIEEHEEGKEYIRCPLQRCGAPVRDVKMHFKARHPTENLPKKGMMRAIIWKDFSPKGKKTRKPKFIKGWYESTKMEKAFKYDSRWELTVYECLDEDSDIIGFEGQPFEVEYIHKGHCHNYTPDILVRFVNGRTEVWEVKPANQTLLERNEDKWRSCQRACDVRGWGFVVITEKGIEKLKKKIERQRITSE